MSRSPAVPPDAARPPGPPAGAACSVLLRGASVLTMNERREVIPRGEVLVEGGTIAHVGPLGSAPLPPGGAGETLELGEGAVVIPGLVQAHVHLCQTLFRNQADDLPLLRWLRERIWPLEAAHDEASLAASAELGLAELLRGGTTAILDMATVHHTEVIFQAAARSGIRALIGKCHMDVDAGQPRALYERPAASLAEAVQLCERWQGAEGGRLGYAFAPRFALSCSEGLLRELAAAARERGARLHTHAAENAEECRLVRAQTGRDNVEYFAAIGLAGPDLVLAHCIHLSQREVELLARHGVAVAHCPSSNLKLGSGLARVPELRAAGITVGLGADGAPCNNNLDAFVEMRLAALLQKPRLGAQVLPAAEVFAMASVEGARALGLEGRIGRLAAGMEADLVVLDLDDLATVPPGDLFSTIVYAAQSRHVRHVMVAGRWVVKDRQLLTLDEERVRAVAKEQLAALLRRL
ncbi:MAG: 5-methylthioadenosine/S-adenosylhomocysteine deaminase [Planctomycetota bacterium]|nr:MAG: 5-methylthioadenosine/S-adenosylhomocysteine deaminase [Planctomycetota bacterium]